jgi:hypothetical protein
MNNLSSKRASGLRRRLGYLEVCGRAFLCLPAISSKDCNVCRVRLTRLEDRQDFFDAKCLAVRLSHA